MTLTRPFAELYMPRNPRASLYLGGSPPCGYDHNANAGLAYPI